MKKVIFILIAMTLGFLCSEISSASPFTYTVEGTFDFFYGNDVLGWDGATMKMTVTGDDSEPPFDIYTYPSINPDVVVSYYWFDKATLTVTQGASTNSYTSTDDARVALENGRNGSSDGVKINCGFDINGYFFKWGGGTAYGGGGISWDLPPDFWTDDEIPPEHRIFDNGAVGSWYALFVTGDQPSNYSNICQYELTSPTASAAVRPVPEPSTMLLLGFGLIGLAGIVRKRMKA